MQPEGAPSFWKRVTRGILWATPGQLDAGLASLATFVTGLSAVRSFDLETLGAYSLLFSAFLVGSQLPAELIFNPSQVLAIDLNPENRLSMLRHSWHRGVLISALGAIVVPMGVLPIMGVMSFSELGPLVLAAAGLALVSPLQDHIRSMLHLSNFSWMAAATSASHFLVTCFALLLLNRTLPSSAPFGALVVGNLVSITIAGFWIARRTPRRVPRPRFRQLVELGGWLLTTGIARTLLGYASRALLTAVVGITALAHVEGARIVAQPLYVLASGLTAQMGPRSIAAASRHDLAAARRWRMRFASMLSLVAIPYTLVVAFPSPLNPFRALAPRAYEVSGLTAFMLFAVWLNSLLRPMKSEFLGARWQKHLAYVTIATGLVEVAAILTGYEIGAYAAPTALALASVLTWISLHSVLNRFYGTVEFPTDPKLEANPTDRVLDGGGRTRNKRVRRSSR